jgi:hypothetical protein
MLVVSTIPHYFSVKLPWTWHNYVIIASSTFSVMWHWYGEPKNMLYYLDYFFAFAWFITDVYRSRRETLKMVITLNAIVFITNICIKYNSDYWLYHSMWHLLSSAKCFYISTYYPVSGASSSPYHA